MKQYVTALTTGLALLGAGSLAVAASPEDRRPEARAYVNFAFGGADKQVESFFYGLRLDHDSRYGTDLPPLLAFDFNRSGFTMARLNGMPVTTELRLNQAETVFTALDWGLVALGAVGLGFTVAAISDSNDESPDPPPQTTGGSTAGGSTTGGGTGGTGGGLLGGGTGGGTGGTGGGLLGGLLGGLAGGGFRAEYGEDALESVERQRLLDGGTGSMGDLIAEN